MDNKEKRYASGYRLSDAFIKRWTRILITILCVGIGAFLVLMIGTLIVFGDVPSDELPSWIMPTMIALGSLGLGIPLIMGAILGGLAIHKYGWIPLLLLVGGLMAIGAARIDGLGFLAPFSVAAMIIGGVGIFVLAIGFTKVPIWFQLPILFSPRFYLRRGKNDKKK